jgi:hypothetical protein
LKISKLRRKSCECRNCGLKSSLYNKLEIKDILYSNELKILHNSATSFEIKSDNISDDFEEDKSSYFSEGDDDSDSDDSEDQISEKA